MLRMTDHGALESHGRHMQQATQEQGLIGTKIYLLGMHQQLEHTEHRLACVVYTKVDLLSHTLHVRMQRLNFSQHGRQAADPCLTSVAPFPSRELPSPPATPASAALIH